MLFSSREETKTERYFQALNSTGIEFTTVHVVIKRLGFHLISHNHKPETEGKYSQTTAKQLTDDK